MMRRETPSDVFGFVANVLDPYQVDPADAEIFLGQNLIVVTPARAAEICDQDASSVSLMDTGIAGKRVFCHKISGYAM